jgi:hypothetical protein
MALKYSLENILLPRIRKYALSNVYELLCWMFVWDKMSGKDEFIKLQLNYKYATNDQRKYENMYF